MRKFSYIFVFALVGLQNVLLISFTAATWALVTLGAKAETLFGLTHALSLPMTYIGSPIPEMVAKLLPVFLVVALYVAILFLLVKRFIYHLKVRSFSPPPSFGKAASFFALGSIAIFFIVLILTVAIIALHIPGIMIVGGLLLGFAQLGNSISFVVTEAGSLLSKGETT